MGRNITQTQQVGDGARALPVTFAAKHRYLDLGNSFLVQHDLIAGGAAGDALIYSTAAQPNRRTSGCGHWQQADAVAVIK